MPVFAKIQNQASKICSTLANNFKEFKSLSKEAQASFDKPFIKSVGTFRNYCQALTNVGKYLKEINDKHRVDLKNLTLKQATDYLEHRKSEVSQKTLDMERQAIQKVLILNGSLSSKSSLEVTKSELKTVLLPRAYTLDQVNAICGHQNEANSLSTMIAYNAGLRAHELLTIERKNEKDVTLRPNKDNEKKFYKNKFEGRNNTVAYIVTGKGGHIREIRLSQELSAKLEERRLVEPRIVKDRTVFYKQKYDLNGGNSWSKSFSKASKAALGWSTGAHGLRHSYAQERMETLKQICGHSKEDALAIVSLEMGHYRSEITTVYLR